MTFSGNVWIRIIRWGFRGATKRTRCWILSKEVHQKVFSMQPGYTLFYLIDSFIFLCLIADVCHIDVFKLFTIISLINKSETQQFTRGVKMIQCCQIPCGQCWTQDTGCLTRLITLCWTEGFHIMTGPLVTPRGRMEKNSTCWSIRDEAPAAVTPVCK